MLDEADRLLDLGFEQKIGDIVAALDARAAEADYAQRRTTALLSATLHGSLGALASLSLRQPVAGVGFSCEAGPDGTLQIGPASAAAGAQQQQSQPPPQQQLAGDAWDAVMAAAAGGTGQAGGDGQQQTAQQQQPAQQQQQYEVPSTLRQRFVEVPCKLRLVALAALLRSSMAAAGGGLCKALVFLSNCDSVEYYHSGALLAGWSVRRWKLVGGWQQAPAAQAATQPRDPPTHIHSHE